MMKVGPDHRAGTEVKVPMDWPPELDRITVPLRRFIAELTAPHPNSLGHPLFGARIMDRWQRWQVERQPNPYAAILSKPDGQGYMRSLGHAVPTVYGIYPSIDALPPLADLPPSFVLKPVGGWSSAGVFLVQGGIDRFSGRRLTRDEIIARARSVSGPKLTAINGAWLAEELLVGFADKTAPVPDFKFFCFGPKIAAIQIYQRVTPELWRNPAWYVDPDWRPIPFRMKWEFTPRRSVPIRPPFFDDMLAIASDVGRRLNIFLRIDMYATDRGPVFGEFTAYPSMGKNFTPRGDAWLGSHWKTLDGGI